MRAWTATIGLIAAVLLWPAIAFADERPVLSDGRAVLEIEGVWRSRGYGYVVRIDGEGRRTLPRRRRALLGGSAPGRRPRTLFH